MGSPGYVHTAVAYAHIRSNRGSERSVLGCCIIPTAGLPTGLIYRPKMMSEVQVSWKALSNAKILKRNRRGRDQDGEERGRENE